MDVKNLFELAIRYWYVTAILYLAVCAFLRWVVDYFFGDLWGFRLVNLTIGLPITALGWLIQLLYRIVTFPGRFRNRRLLKEVFGIIEISAASEEINQKKVDDRLLELARAFHDYGRDQVEARKGTDANKLQFANQMVSWSKKRFWEAHALAKKNKFRVPEKVSEALAK